MCLACLVPSACLLSCGVQLQLRRVRARHYDRSSLQLVQLRRREKARALWLPFFRPLERSSTPPSSVVQGEVEGQFVLSFKADAENLLVSEAQKLVHMVAYPEVLTKLTVRVSTG